MLYFVFYVYIKQNLDNRLNTQQQQNTCFVLKDIGDNRKICQLIVHSQKETRVCYFRCQFILPMEGQDLEELLLKIQQIKSNKSHAIWRPIEQFTLIGSITVRNDLQNEKIRYIQTYKVGSYYCVFSPSF